MKNILLLILPVIYTCNITAQDSAWKLLGNAGTTNAHFLGTTDNRPLFFRVNNLASGRIDPGGMSSTFLGFQTGAVATGTGNSLFGFRAGTSVTTGSYNTAIGHSSLYANTTGRNNTATGASAMRNNLNGVDNAAGGYQSLFSNTIGNYNTAYGVNSLYSNVSGHNNVSVGHRSMFSNTTAVNNTAVGLAALFSNTTGTGNVAVGFAALYRTQQQDELVAIGDSALHWNTTGYANTATGGRALTDNTTGNNNTTAGYLSLHDNTTGWANTAFGSLAMRYNNGGSNNTALGYGAIYSCVNASGNTAVGYQALSSSGTRDRNVALGYGAGLFTVPYMYGNTLVGTSTTVNLGGADTCINSTALGNTATITAPNQVRIGNSNVTSIGGFANWSNISDSRFKKNIQQNVPGLDFILQLNPVTYHLDIKGLNAWIGNGDSAALINPQKENEIITGFIAQEVEALATRIKYKFSGVDAPKNGKDLYGLRYAEFVVPLVKAMQEQQQMIDTLKQQNELLQQQLREVRIKLGMENIITLKNNLP